MKLIDLFSKLLSDRISFLEKENEKLKTQLAGCGVAALGCLSDLAKKEDYGWSQSYQDVVDLRKKYNKLQEDYGSLRDAIKMMADYSSNKNNLNFGLDGYSSFSSLKKDIKTDQNELEGAWPSEADISFWLYINSGGKNYKEDNYFSNKLKTKLIEAKCLIDRWDQVTSDIIIHISHKEKFLQEMGSIVSFSVINNKFQLWGANIYFSNNIPKNKGMMLVSVKGVPWNKEDQSKSVVVFPM